ncbi:outer membrane protein assembly factor BamB family protein [Natronospora cellulosivora (SeqCode)]
MNRDKDTLWRTKLKGEIYTIQFFGDTKIILTGSGGLKCINIDNGKVEWTDKIGEVVYTYNQPVLYKNELYTGTEQSDKIYKIDISTGEYLKKYDIEGKAMATQLGSKCKLYFIARENGYDRFVLNSIDLKDETIEEIYEFHHQIKYVRDPMVINEDNIIIPIIKGYDINVIYSINISDRKLNWKTELPNTAARPSILVHHKDNIYFVDSEQNTLNELNIKTGEIENIIYIEEITRPVINYDRKNILIYGNFYSKDGIKQYYTELYVYNLKEKEMEIIEKNYHNAKFSGDNVVYEYDNKIFLYNIETKDTKELYSFDKELIDIYTSNNHLLLVLANDRKDVHAHRETATYILLELPKIED